jgi:CheY-like chemotaxis protein
MARERTPTIAITGMRLDGMNGIDFLVLFRRMHPAVPVIIVTTYETPATMREALRLGAHAYIIQPFSLDEIRSAVFGALRAEGKHGHPNAALAAPNAPPEIREQPAVESLQGIKDTQEPRILNVETIRAGDAAERAERLLAEKQWVRAEHLLRFANGQYPWSADVKKALGRFHLLRQNIDMAEIFFALARRRNPGLDAQKELGWIQLELKQYPAAISLLNEHLDRYPADLEAHNLLLQCFYETGQYETAIDLAETLVRYDCHDPCFANNLYLARIMQAVTTGANPAKIPRYASNDFLTYNHSVIAEVTPTHNRLDRPTLKSKLLFMEYRFRHRVKSTLYFTRTEVGDEKKCRTWSPIVTIGRHGYDANEVQVPPGGMVCRRHCLIVNCRSDPWLYDLESAGTFLNNAPVKPKAPIGGPSTLRIGRSEYRVADSSKALV